jgi:AraC family L-rhamnose operon transcriptional activator RhaR
MKRYQPLALQRLDIRVPGLCVHRLVVHRHLPQTSGVRPHAHRHAQCLLYLTGQGRQQAGDREFAIQAGTAVFLPPQVRHAFLRGANRRPVCLVLDVEWRGAGRKPACAAPLPAAMFREAQRHIATVLRLQQQAPGGPPLRMGAVILQLLELLLAGLQMTPWSHREHGSPVARKVERILATPEADTLPLGRIARLAGYQRDYLNRVLKSQTGMTLGQARARQRVSRAQHLLREPRSITEVAERIGFADANYFARWFRKQTGMTPSHWRRTSVTGD